MVKTLFYNGIKWILVRDDGKNQLYRHPTDSNRRLSVLDPNYTFQPATLDTFLTQSSPDNNWGGQTLIRVGGGYTGSAYRSLLKFDISSQVPAGAIINSAALSLYYYQHSTNDPVGRTIWAYRLTQTGWTEYGATWNKYDGTNAWAIAGGDYTTTNGASAAVPASYGWMSWTVTAQVQTAVDSVSRVAHFLMRDGTETGSALYMTDYYSSDYTTDTSLRPKLYVDWQTMISVSDSGSGSESASVGLSVADSGVGTESSPVIGLLGTDVGVGVEAVATGVKMSDEGKGAEFAWRIKPSSPMIDDITLPHVLSIRIPDPATMSDKKVQGGSLPRRTMVGKSGRTVEIDGWSDDQTEIDALDALRDGARHTFYPQTGDSFSVLVTGFESNATADQYNHRAYRLSLAESN